VGRFKARGLSCLKIEDNCVIIQCTEALVQKDAGPSNGKFVVTKKFKTPRRIVELPERSGHCVTYVM